MTLALFINVLIIIINIPCGGVSKLVTAAGPQTTESECLAATDTLQLQ